MGEAKRRKKLLGNEYGKPSIEKSQAAKITKAQTLQGIKRTELSRPPTPELEHLKSQLSSVELRDWVINEWVSLVIFANPEEGRRIASKLLKGLQSKCSEDLNSDPTVAHAISPVVEVAVGINVSTWTVWASVGNSSTGFVYATSDADEFKLF